MADWGVRDMAAALPTNSSGLGGDSVDRGITKEETPAALEALTKTPQEHGWVAKQAYDYAVYSKSNKELAADRTGVVQGEGEGGQEPEADVGVGGVGGLRLGEWASNAQIYEWNDDFGDVGPKFPELEKQLFGSENHVKAGIKFSE
jgi:ATP-dependent RNA helicase DDX3X